MSSRISQAGLTCCCGGGGVFMVSRQLGFGVPYFNTFLFKGTIMKQKFIFFLPGYLKAQTSPPVQGRPWFPDPVPTRNSGVQGCMESLAVILRSPNVGIIL